MWPTENTGIYLAIGLLPLIYITILSLRYGMKEVSSLRFVGTILIWIGYQLSPFISFVTGQLWDQFLLVPSQVDIAILFSTLCMCAFLIGYASLFRKRHARLRAAKISSLMLPKVKGQWILAALIVVLVVTIYSVGGMEEFWSSKFNRGYGQFEKRDFANSVRQMITVLLLPIQITLTVMGVLLILQNDKLTKNYIIGFTALFVASLVSMHGFSRAAGYPFILLSFLAIRLQGRRRAALAIMSLVVAFSLASIGINERSSYNPGVGNFLSAAWSTVFEVGGYAAEQEKDGISNPLDATPPFTRKVDNKSQGQENEVELAARFFWNLNPLPSEIFPIYSIGTDLTEVMGTVGSSGITTPALAEVYYVFGMVGALFVLFLGGAYGWFERYALVNPSIHSSVAMILVFLSLGIGLHSSMRAMTRPMLYALFVIAAARLFGTHLEKIRRRKKRHQIYSTSKSQLAGKQASSEIPK